MLSKLSTASLAVAFSFATLHAVAAEPEELIKYRQNVMSAQGGHVSAIAAILRNQVDYGSHLSTHAESLAATAVLVGDVFPPDSALGETDALDAIWDEPEAFAEAVQQLETAAEAFRAAVADDGDVGAAFRDLGGACKNCHDNFRASE